MAPQNARSWPPSAAAVPVSRPLVSWVMLRMIRTRIVCEAGVAGAPRIVRSLSVV
jgi:hypothetical protein